MSTLDAAERVLLYVDEHYGRSGTTLKGEIFIWGFSLGGAIAAHLAYKFQHRVCAFPGPEPKDADVRLDLG
jgi:putative lipase involved disintegration of autophagic bodies